MASALMRLRAGSSSSAAVGGDVAKAVAAPLPADARLIVGDISKPRVLGSVFGVDDRLGGRHVQHECLGKGN